MDLTFFKRKTILRSLEVLLVFMPFILPAFFKEIGTIDTLSKVWCVASVTFAFVKFFSSGKRAFPRHIIILFIIMISMLLSTIANVDTGKLYVCMYSILTLVLPSVILFIYLQWDYECTLKVLSYVLFLEVLGNYFTQLMFPEGLMLVNDKRIAFLLGIENRFVFTYIAFLAFGLPVFLSGRSLFKRIYIFGLLICNLSLIRAWSVGAMLGIIVFDLLFILTCVDLNPLNIWTSTIIWVTLLLLLVVFRVQTTPFLENFIVNVLKKDVTFSGRLPIWIKTLGHIRERLLLGYGLQSTPYLSTQFLLGVSHPHCQMLQILYQGGLVGILLHLWYGAECLFKLSRLSEKKLYRMYISMYMALMTMLIVDSWTSTSYYFMIYVLIAIYPNEKEEVKNVEMVDAGRWRNDESFGI